MDVADLEKCHWQIVSMLGYVMTWPISSVIKSCVRTFIHSFARSFIHCFIYSTIQWPSSFIDSVYLAIHLFISSLICTPSITHSFDHPLPLSLSNSHRWICFHPNSPQRMAHARRSGARSSVKNVSIHWNHSQLISRFDLWTELDLDDDVIMTSMSPEVRSDWHAWLAPIFRKRTQWKSQEDDIVWLTSWNGILGVWSHR